MAKKEKKQLILAFFETESSADEAVKLVKAWDKADDEVKLGAIGILAKDEKGKVKTQKLGKRKTGSGAVLGALVVALTGGMSLVGGALVGGVLGSFFKQGLGMSKEDLAGINAALDGGKAAVGVLAAPSEAVVVAAKLADLGGAVETHEVSEEAVAQVEEAVETAPEEEAPAEEAPAEEKPAE